MSWIDIAAIVTVTVTANHLGLIAAAEKVIGHSLPVAGCVKCATFWCVLAYGLSGDIAAACDTSQRLAGAIPSAVVRWLAISILCSYLALWLELAEGFIDTIYSRIYDTLYTTEDKAGADT